MRFINRKTLALAGAAAALVAVGSAGSAVADSLIGSADIQNESIRSADIKNGKVRIHDLSPQAVASLQGQAGKDGVNGKNGVDGKDGKDGKSFVSPAAGAGYAGWPTDAPHHEMWAANSYGETVQKCKAGEVVTGGGFSQQGGDATDLGGMTKGVQILVSAPYTAEYVPISEADSRFHADRWVVRGYNGTDAPIDVRAWVLCVPAA
jgi:hypothetical protein